MTEPRTGAGRQMHDDRHVSQDCPALTWDGKPTGEKCQWLNDILAIEREATLARPDERPVHVITEEHRHLERFAGILAVLRSAEEQGFPIHVATRSTCVEHIEKGDDQAESWALQPSLVLDVERLMDAANNVGEADPDLLHWDVDQQWWELPQGPNPFLKAVAAEYARLEMVESEHETAPHGG